MRIYVHGNCQAPALAEILKQALPGACIDAIQVHLFTSEDAPGHLERLANADLLLLIPLAPTYRGEAIGSSWMAENRKPGASVLMWPSIYFRGDQPASFTVGDLMSESAPYVDGTVVAEFLAGAPLPPPSDSEIRTIAEGSLAELCRREQEGGLVPISDMIAEDYGRRKVFHTVSPDPTIAGAVREPDSGPSGIR